MPMAGLYRRLLPSPPAIDFASSQGKKLFVEAIQGGTMEGFFKLISSFQTQSEPAYCGLASLAMVLNALAIDPGRKWKGPWRWFDESMLDCCEPLEKVKSKGISFGKVVCLAQCAGTKVKAFHTNHSNLDDFRKYVKACSASEDCHVISSYHRGTFKQTGEGHFSPIGGYHAGRDMALILDVARFKYPPHWVPLNLLWDAMNTLDQSSGHHRGFMLISRLHRAPALLYTLSCKHESWASTAKYLVEDVPSLLGLEEVEDVKNILSIVINSLPSKFADFIKWVAEVRRQEDGDQSLSKEEKGRLAAKFFYLLNFSEGHPSSLEEVLKQVQEIGLYKHVKDFLSSEISCCHSIVSLSSEESLSLVAADICCQGAGLMKGNCRSSVSYCCNETGIKCIRTKENKSITVISGKVVNGNDEQQVDVLVPSSQTTVSCSGPCPSSYKVLHPENSDVLTALLLSLPPETWSGIKNKKLLQEIHRLVSTEDFPNLLREEVLHLRGQLLALKRCKNNKPEEELGAPVF